MRKRDELTSLDSCMSRARDDEWTFVLLGRDASTPETIRDWVVRRIRLGKNRFEDSQMADAIRAGLMIESEQGVMSSIVYRVFTGDFQGAIVRSYFINNSGNADCRHVTPFGPHQAGELIVVRPDQLWPARRPDDPKVVEAERCVQIMEAERSVQT